MRFVTYDSGQGPRAGVLRDGEVADVWDGLGEDPPDGDAGIRSLLRHRGIDAAVRAFAPASAVPLGDVSLLPPVPNPGKLILIGLNYLSHAHEQGVEPPEMPTFFAKFANALAPPAAEVPLPPYSEKVDYEAEVAFVVGRRCRDVEESDALDQIAGFMLLNDLSARDYQFRTPQWMPGKVFDGSAPCGPALVTADEAGPADAIELSLTLNGETMQSASTADLVHSIPALVAYLSRLMTLEPGDVVSTGTPAGVGSLRQPHVWLKPGDEVVVESPTLGRLQTRIV
jgi:acylpyruvate hydrolase